VLVSIGITAFDKTIVERESSDEEGGQHRAR
jgi:hypothetical protein